MYFKSLYLYKATCYCSYVSKVYCYIYSMFIRVGSHYSSIFFTNNNFDCYIENGQNLTKTCLLGFLYVL